MSEYWGWLWNPTEMIALAESPGWSFGLTLCYSIGHFGLALAHLTLLALIGWMHLRQRWLPMARLIFVVCVFLFADLAGIIGYLLSLWCVIYPTLGLMSVLGATVVWAALIRAVLIKPKLESIVDFHAARTAELQEEQERFQSLVEMLCDPVFVLDPYDQDCPLRILYVNSAITKTHGYQPEELIGTSILKLDTPECAELAPQRRDQILKGDQLCFEVEHRHRDGHVLQFEVRSTLITWRGRAAILAIDRDITARKQAESEARQARELLQTIFGHVPALIVVRDSELRPIVVNRHYVETLGWDLPSIHAQPDFLRQLYSCPGLHEQFIECLKQADGRFRDFLAHTRDGRRLTLTWAHLRLADNRILSLGLNITERRQAEADRDRMWQISSDAMCIAGFDGFFKRLSPAWQRLLGYSETDLLSQPWLNFVHPDDQAATNEALSQLASGETIREFENRYCDVQGEYHWLSWSAVPLLTEGLIFAVARDITKRKLAQQALRETTARYELLANHVQDVVSLHNSQGQFIYVSPSSLQASGHTPEELMGRSYAEMIHPEDLPTVTAALKRNLQGQSTRTEWRLLHKSGDYVWRETHTTPVRTESGELQIIYVTRDVTQRKLLEAELRQAQKLEALGQLSGGIAHDFNNLLTIINGCAELLQKQLPAGSPLRSLADDLSRAGKRGAMLTRQLLAFSRKQIVKVDTFDINAALQDTYKMLMRVISSDVRLVLRLALDSGRVRMDRGLLEQVLLNLVINARDALPEGGEITLSTQAVEVLEGQSGRPAECPPGQYVRVSVADNGVGMSSEIMSHLFEPFFTTKPVGQGTGLGLATVHGIVGQAGGFITVESQVGKGSTFHVHLPHHEPVIAQVDTPHSEPAIPKGKETILVVEDEDGVRSFCCTVLQLQGYQVIEAANARDALAVWETLPTPPDLLLVDLVMPGLGGRELAEQLLQRRPNLKIGYLSGYTTDEVIRLGVAEARVAFLRKPFSTAELARFVRSVLDGTMPQQTPRAYEVTP